MDKVGILTFHAAHNYGSMLQAFALKAIISTLGYKCEIINYRNKKQKKLYSILSVGIKTQIIRVLHISKYTRRYKSFECYLKEYLTKSSEINTHEDIDKYLKEFYAIICGSDQIWNLSSNTYDSDTIYYLPFKFKGKKIAYAPSMGSDIDINLIKTKLITYIKDFSSLSAREDKLSNVLENCLNKNIPTVLDPTLLVKKETWDKQIVPIKETNYICFYSLIYSEDLVKLALQASKLLNLKIINLSPRAKYASVNAFIQKYDIGPKEFISYIKNANLVITNSFHGTVFSILEKTPLFSIILDQNKPDFRRQNLFSITKLYDMYFYVNDTYNIVDRFNKIKDIDYSYAEEQLEKAKIDSINYLKEALL